MADPPMYFRRGPIRPLPFAVFLKEEMKTSLFISKEPPNDLSYAADQVTHFIPAICLLVKPQYCHTM